jgi:hypothetical protein
MELIVEKQPGGLLKASNDEDAARILKLPTGTGLRVEIKKIRNYEFHKKFFAMLGIGFEAFEPAEQFFKGMPVQKSFERFRKDCIIAAGYYDVVANLKGEVRAEAASISFAKMGQDEFEKLYTAVCNVLLQRVLKNYTRADLDQVVEKLINF